VLIYPKENILVKEYTIPILVDKGSEQQAESSRLKQNQSVAVYAGYSN
jgi:hypothetical protein